MNEQSPPKKLTRSRNDRYIGGVAAGLAERFNVDPLFIRIAFVFSLALGGLGLLAYGVLLAVMPVEGNASAPMPPIEPKRRNLMIGLAVAVGIVCIATADSGDFGAWLFGFWPGTVFGILFWTAAAAGAIWLLATGRLNRGTLARPEGPTPPASDPASPPASSTSSPVPPAEASSEAVTYADSPSQLSTEVMETRQMEARRAAAAGEGGTPDDSGDSPASAMPVRDDGPSTIGRIMLWFAIGLSALFVFCILFVISAGSTALFGGVPMAAVVILLGGGMVFAGVRGRRQLSLWLLVAAIAVTIPMATVSIADLRVDGSYGDINETPITMADVPSDGFRMAAGDSTIDLRKFKFDRQPLELEVRSGMGLTSVIVPDDVCVTGAITGKAGVASFRGRQSNGIDVDLASAEANQMPGQHGNPVVNLDGEFKLGAFEVVDGTQWRRHGSGGSFDDDHHGPGDGSEAAARRRASLACSATGEPAGNSTGKKTRS